MRRLARPLLLASLLPALAAASPGCGDGGGGGDAPDAAADASPDAAGDAGPTTFAYEVPLDPASPWPKFRRTARQDGRLPEVLAYAGGEPWAFPTGKGIFSTPVLGGDGTIYIGSGDRTFYALRRDGSVRWSLETGEIIDSSALLDDEGRVIFGSGDGRLYARDAATGAELWTFAADDPAATGAFIDWFEGNVAIGPDGTLYVPNDGFRVYALDRADGSVRWRFETVDQTWSLPAVDAATGRLFLGNNNLLPLLGDNVFALEADGSLAWSASVPGSVAASPLLTPGGLVVAGGFDGFVHAWDAATGAAAWTVPARDHVYASPAALPDGALVQAAADGTVYALEPADGAVRWAFDTLEPIRSSPAVDGAGRVVFGSGEGRLYVLEPDGTPRWSMQLVEGDRNDLNASPALGDGAIVLAAESGEIFRVPWDWCLQPAAAADARCRVGGGEGLPAEGARLLYTERFGSPRLDPPDAIAPNRPLAFTLLVREAGDTRLSVLDADDLAVTVTPAVPVAVRVSGDRRFLTVVPDGAFAPDPATGRVTVSVAAGWLVDPARDGLATTGGTPGGTVSEAFSFALADDGPGPAALPVPAAPGEPGATWEIRRLAAPLPTILPSYNQIGFDSLHWLVGLVEAQGDRATAWMIGALPGEAEGPAVPDPATRVMFPLTVTRDGAAATFESRDGFALEALNARLTFDTFRFSVRLGADGAATGPGELTVTAVCGGIPFYGQFLQQLGFCNPQTDLLVAYGAALLEPHGGGAAAAPAGVGEVAWSRTAAAVEATLTGATLRTDAHRFGILLADAATGAPLALDYGPGTAQLPAGGGPVTSVRLTVPSADLPATVRATLMVDVSPAAAATLGPP